MRTIICSLVVLSVLVSARAAAAADLDAATLHKLVQLEQRYFGHSFDSDSDNGRAERLEKLILGEPTAGSSEQRIERLVTTTADSSAEDNGSKENQIQATGSDTNELHSQSQSQLEDNPSTSAAEQNNFNSADDASDAYPHITSLENTILGHCSVNQPLNVRLEFLEKQAFGRPSDNSDFSQRTDALDQYVEQTLHKKSFQTEPSIETASSEDSQDQADYPHITSLEIAILGQSFTGQPLPDRLGRMESKAFGSPSTDTDLSQRTDALEKYAEKTLHKKQFNKDTSKTATSTPQQSGVAKQLFSSVGRSLLGMAGGGMGIGGGGMGIGGGGMGFGGRGMGLGGGGSGGTRSRQTTQQQTEPVETHLDDPAVYASEPPAPDAKMLIKVGWCELHVFGHTFPTMHLPERLGQLNQELNFEPGKSNLELMDDIGVLLKTVQAKSQSIGYKSQTPAVR